MSGSHREFSSPTGDFWCCVGSGMESHAKHGDSIYWHSGDVLYVNLYIPSRLSWHAQAITLELTTVYPLSDRIDLRVVERRHLGPLTVALRIPAWCSQPETSINGRPVVVNNVEGYAKLRRPWRDGDVLTLILPRTLRMEPTADDPRTVALLYGPMVLAADLGSATDRWQDPAPVLVGASPLDQIFQNQTEPATFVTKGLGRPHDLTLRPFTLQYDRNTAVYFQRFDEPGWLAAQVRDRSEDAHQHDLAERSADVI